MSPGISSEVEPMHLRHRFRFGDALSVSISVLVGTVTVQWDLPEWKVYVCGGEGMELLLDASLWATWGG